MRFCWIACIRRMDSMARLPQANNACMHLMLYGSILNIYIENILSIPSKSISTLHVSILFTVRPQLRATQVNQDEEAPAHGLCGLQGRGGSTRWLPVQSGITSVQCTQAKQRREDRHDNCNRTLTFLSILTSPTRVFLLYYSSSSSSLHIFGGANNMPPKKNEIPFGSLMCHWFDDLLICKFLMSSRYNVVSWQ
jgi:hypothetical protein